jgi:hypothetical protein
MLALLLFGFVKIIQCNDSTLQRRPITMKIDPEVHLHTVEVGENQWFESDVYIFRYSQFPAAMSSTPRILHPASFYYQPLWLFQGCSGQRGVIQLVLYLSFLTRCMYWYRAQWMGPFDIWLQQFVFSLPDVCTSTVLYGWAGKTFGLDTWFLQSSRLTIPYRWANKTFG